MGERHRGELWDDPLQQHGNPAIRDKLDTYIRDCLAQNCISEGVPCHYTVICWFGKTAHTTICIWETTSAVLSAKYPTIREYGPPTGALWEGIEAIGADWSYLCAGTIILHSRFLPKDPQERATEVAWLRFQLLSGFFAAVPDASAAG